MARAADTGRATPRAGLLVNLPGRIGIAVVLALSALPAAADTCPALFADGQPPAIVNAKLAVRTDALCFDAFAVLHSGVTRTPLYSAEYLTRASVAEARAVARDDSFHEETRLPPDGRAKLEDYARSGFDRGHLAPAGDMPTLAAQAQSFTLANIVPQDRVLNRGLWGDIEESIRRTVSRRGSLYVVTGAIFSGDSIQQIGTGVLVPTALFKALYDPATGEAGAYLVRNDATKEWRAVSIDALRQEAGLDVFPALAPAARARAMSLPDPHVSGGEARHRPRADDGWGAWLDRELARYARKLLRELLRSIL